MKSKLLKITIPSMRTMIALTATVRAAATERFAGSAKDQVKSMNDSDEESLHGLVWLERLVWFASGVVCGMTILFAISVYLGKI